ncbi:hypothetical protein ANCCAN_25402, partial [Ancylostoma caninum]
MAFQRATRVHDGKRENGGEGNSSEIKGISSCDVPRATPKRREDAVNSVLPEMEEDGWYRLIISPVTPAHTGVYTAVAVNEVGESRTSATLHVVPSTTARTSTHEDMLQEDVYERIGRPTERTEEVVRRESMQYSETTSLPAPRELETTKTTTDKRWVEVRLQALTHVRLLLLSYSEENNFARTYLPP